MNKRQKKKTRHWSYTRSKVRKRNKALCKRYPFLIPRSVWTDEISWFRKPYDNTLFDDIPKGWRKAFGLMFCEDLRNELVKYNYLKQYRVVQIKEKYAGLRWYDNGSPGNVNNIINDYSHLSENICINCGKPDVPVTDMGWMLPECEDCFITEQKKRNKYMKQPLSDEEIETYYQKSIVSDSKMVDERKVNCYSNEESKEIIYDLRDKAEKIRAKWRCEHGS